eukprot:6979218-Alexandrium_andersonii.AAC.1
MPTAHCRGERAATRLLCEGSRARNCSAVECEHSNVRNFRILYNLRQLAHSATSTAREFAVKETSMILMWA